jgi:hypothetical protein
MEPSKSSRFSANINSGNEVKRNGSTEGRCKIMQVDDVARMLKATGELLTPDIRADMNELFC